MAIGKNQCEHGRLARQCEICELERENAELRAQLARCIEAANAAIEWIDAVPSETKLPAMPGFDRDWFDSTMDLTQAKLDAEVLRAAYAYGNDFNPELQHTDTGYPDTELAIDLIEAVQAAQEGW